MDDGPGGPTEQEIEDAIMGMDLRTPPSDAPRDQSRPHPAVAQVLRWFDSSHLPADLALVVDACRVTATMMVERYPDGGPELTAGLRHLLEAKDCFVRAAITHAKPATRGYRPSSRRRTRQG